MPYGHGVSGHVSPPFSRSVIHSAWAQKPCPPYQASQIPQFISKEHHSVKYTSQHVKRVGCGEHSEPHHTKDTPSHHHIHSITVGRHATDAVRTSPHPTGSPHLTALPDGSVHAQGSIGEAKLEVIDGLTIGKTAFFQIGQGFRGLLQSLVVVIRHLAQHLCIF